SNLFELVQPVGVNVQAAVGPGRLWKVATGRIDLKGDTRRAQAEVTLEWPNLGRGTLSVTNLQSDLFAELFTNKVESITVHRLEANVGWTNTPAVFGVDLRASGFAEGEWP